jgi:hypothetical protein
MVRVVSPMWRRWSPDRNHDKRALPADTTGNRRSDMTRVGMAARDTSGQDRRALATSSRLRSQATTTAPAVVATSRTRAETLWCSTSSPSRPATSGPSMPVASRRTAELGNDSIVARIRLPHAELTATKLAPSHTLGAPTAAAPVATARATRGRTVVRERQPLGVPVAVGSCLSTTP